MLPSEGLPLERKFVLGVETQRVDKDSDLDPVVIRGIRYYKNVIRILCWNDESQSLAWRAAAAKYIVKPNKRPTLKYIYYKKRRKSPTIKLNKSVEQELNLSGS